MSAAVKSQPPEDMAGLFARLRRGLHAQALAILADTSLAEDVVQDAFLRVWRRRERLRDRAQLDGYVYAAVRNLALDQVRRRETQAAHAERVAVSVIARQPGGPDVERINLALAELPALQREVVVLRVYLGLSFAEVAARTESPLGTVHSRYRYAMTQLRGRLVQEHASPVDGAS